MRIIIETCAHENQPYPTTGMWWFDKEGADIHVQVSDLGDWRMEALVGIHELIEAVLCRHAGVSEEEVTAFDIEWEKRAAYARERAPLGNFTDTIAEPGEDPDAPYYREHQIATGIERLLAVALGVSWADYEAKNEALYGR